ncbi:hypothetical protein ACFYR1_22990 [Streptomyces canus]
MLAARVDPEAALRAAARAYRDAIRDAIREVEAPHPPDNVKE